jgi:hypothetical protein
MPSQLPTKEPSENGKGNMRLQEMDEKEETLAKKEESTSRIIEERFGGHIARRVVQDKCNILTRFKVR